MDAQNDFEKYYITKKLVNSYLKYALVKVSKAGYGENKFVFTIIFLYSFHLQDFLQFTDRNLSHVVNPLYYLSNLESEIQSITKKHIPRVFQPIVFLVTA